MFIVFARPDVFEASSAQEEGGFLVFDRGRGTLMLYLDGELTMVKRSDRDNQLSIRFGSQDSVFMLRWTDLKNCAAIEDAVTEPEPGVKRR